MKVYGCNYSYISVTFIECERNNSHYGRFFICNAPEHLTPQRYFWAIEVTPSRNLST